MTTYADPTRCPDCTAVLPQAPETCPACALPLTGQTAVDLFATLQQADRLLLRLRGLEATVPAGAAREPARRPTAPATAPLPRRNGPVGPRLRGASVPRILLTLGALCLLVAAVIFLAVAWTWLGVGGRTLVLVAGTVVALGLAGVLHGRGLRVAGEALSVVGLGLLALDVIGARHAGWLGQLGDYHLTTLTGAVVATGSLVLLTATSSRPLVAPALIGPVAVFVAGLAAEWNTPAPAPMLVTTVVLLLLGRVGTALPSTALRATSLALAVLAWTNTVSYGVGLATDDSTIAHLWGHGAIWPLIAATLAAAAVGPVVGLRRTGTLAGYGVAALLGSYVVVLAALDNSLTVATLSLLPVAAGWTVVVARAPERLRHAAAIPLAGTLVLPLAASLALAATATQAVLGTGDPFTQPFGAHVAATSPGFAPWLLVPCLVVVVAAGCALAGLARPIGRRVWPAVLGSAAVAGGVATLPLYDVPLAAVVGVLALGGAAALAYAGRLTGHAADALRVLGAALVAVSVVAALPNNLLTALVLALAATAALLLMRRTDVTGAIAACSFPPAFAGLVWAAADVAGVPAYDRAVPALLVLGALAIWRPRPPFEVSAAVAGVVVSVAAILDADDLLWASAIQLTVAGVLVTASSLINPSRRALAWPGGLLLAAATWVRLAEIGVHTPEAYTLPSAVALTVVGAWRLRRDDTAASLTLLAPGLALATVPSLLATLDDPVSWRALVLGFGCLTLVLTGVRMRWSAPLAVGSVVGGLLVLRELAPYAAGVPSWLLIGLSGVLLTVVGVTWEDRMRDLRTASSYLGRLR